MSAARDRRGVPFLVAAPSGTGKTTVCRALLERDPLLRFSVSHTTRPARAGERDGEHYHFVDANEFRRMVEEGAFLEHAEYAGQLYGTSWASLQEPLDAGHDLLLEIEVQGALQVRERRDDVVFVFLLPPSLPVLEERLRTRGTDSEDAIDRRLALVDRELAAADVFDYAVVNDALSETVDQLLEIVAAVRAGRRDGLEERYGREGVLKRWRR